MPGFIGGDHAFKFGGYWRDSNTTSINHTGGFATVALPDRRSTQRLLAGRDGLPGGPDPRRLQRVRPAELLGLRAGHDHARPRDAAARRPLRLQPATRRGAASIAANPLGRPWLPAIVVPGADPGVAFNNFSPRLGLTYDLPATARRSRARTTRATTARSATAASPGTINPVGSTTLRYPWVDANGNGSADVGEITLSDNPLSASTNWSAAEPGQHGLGQLGRSEPEERHDRRVHRRRGSRGRRGLRGGRQLHLAPVRQLLVERSRGHHVGRLGGGDLHAGGERLPGRRRHAHQRGGLPDGHVLPAGVPAADGRDADQRARLQPHLQRLRADRPQADVATTG